MGKDKKPERAKPADLMNSDVLADLGISLDDDTSKDTSNNTKTNTPDNTNTNTPKNTNQDTKLTEGTQADTPSVTQDTTHAKIQSITQDATPSRQQNDTHTEIPSKPHINIQNDTHYKVPIDTHNKSQDYTPVSTHSNTHGIKQIAYFLSHNAIHTIKHIGEYISDTIDDTFTQSQIIDLAISQIKICDTTKPEIVRNKRYTFKVLMDTANQFEKLSREFSLKSGIHFTKNEVLMVALQQLQTNFDDNKDSLVDIAKKINKKHLQIKFADNK